MARRSSVRVDATAGDEGLRGIRAAFAITGACLVIGAFLPWATVSAPRGVSFTVNSLDRANDGWVTLLAGVIAVGVAVARVPRMPSTLAGLAGVVASIVAVDAWVDLRRVIERAEQTTPAPVEGLIGPGLWLTLLASLAVVAVSVWRMAEPRSARPVPS